MSEIRVRFAPSPTGFLHVGGARTAIFNWLFARNTGGKFLLRIEDTDPERSKSELSGQIIRSMNWLGMEADEPIVYQALNLKRHCEVVEELLKKGSAYYAFETPEELEAKRKEAGALKVQYKYDRASLDLDKNTVEKYLKEGKPYTVRFRVPEGETEFEDIVHGKTVFNNSEIEDFVLMRSDGSPVYQIAVVVDDHDMRISHVIRGDDHLSNTPKQILIYNALGWEVPMFAHLPMILDEQKKKLSKRRNPVSVEEYKDKGYLPDALFNFLTLLGFAPGMNSLSQNLLKDEKAKRENLNILPPLSFKERGTGGEVEKSLSPKDLAEGEVTKPVAPYPTEKARALRKSETLSEKKLWNALRDRKIEGKKFRRQHPLGYYIVDFFLAELNLIIEVDGSIHEVTENKEYDINRQTELESAGYVFLRFSNSDVMNRFDEVMSRIRDYVSTPHPLTPLPEGEGSKKQNSQSFLEVEKDNNVKREIQSTLPPLSFKERGTGGEVEKEPPQNREIFSKNELIKIFTFDRVNKKSAVFDMKKLDWINSEYIKSADPELIAALVTEDLKTKDINNVGSIEPAYVKSVVNLMKERVSTINDFAGFGKYFFMEPEGYDSKGLAKHWNAEIKSVFVGYFEQLKKIDTWETDLLEKELREFAGQSNVKAGDLIHILRLSLTGMTISPGIFELMKVLEKEKVINRISSFISNTSTV